MATNISDQINGRLKSFDLKRLFYTGIYNDNNPGLRRGKSLGDEKITVPNIFTTFDNKVMRQFEVQVGTLRIIFQLILSSLYFT